MKRLALTLAASLIVGCGHMETSEQVPAAEWAQAAVTDGQAPGSWVLRAEGRDDADVGDVPRLSYESSFACDPINRKVLMWGGHGLRYDSPQLDETWLIDPATLAAERVEPDRRPVGSCCVREMAFDTAGGVALQCEGHSTNHGWQIRRRVLMRFSMPWAFDASDRQWTPMRPWPCPPGPAEPFKGWPWTGWDYSPDHDVTVLFSGEQRPNDTWLYDYHANTWTQTHPEPSPPRRLQAGFAYHAGLQRFVLLGGSKWDKLGDTWLYDPAEGRWTELKPKASPPPGVGPILSYDAAAGAMLCFYPARVDDKLALKIWQLDPATPTWHDVTPSGAGPAYGVFDVQYVPELNVHLVGPGAAAARGRPTTRQWWTYRHVAGQPPPRGNRPLSVNYALQWAVHGRDLLIERRRSDAIQSVLRAKGPNPARLDWEELPYRRQMLGKGVDGFRDESAEPGHVYHYKLKVDGRWTPPKRNQPSVPGLPTVAPMSETRVEIAWPDNDTHSPRQYFWRSVAGWNVYRAHAVIGSSRPTELSRINTFADPGFVKLNDEPLTEPRYVDEAIDLAEAAPALGYKWAVYAYRVTAVGTNGVESGPSPWASTIPEMPAMPRVTLELPGRVWLSWKPLPSKAIVGYNVWRLREREVGTRTAEKMNDRPIAETFWEDATLPGTGMRRYYIEAVDKLGQQGIYSGGAWAFRKPTPEPQR